MRLFMKQIRVLLIPLLHGLNWRATLERCLPHSVLHPLLIQVMPPDRTRGRIDAESRSRQHILPSPVAHRIGVFHRQRIRQPYLATSQPQIRHLLRPHHAQMSVQRLDQTRRQHRHPMLAALAIAHKDLAAG
jgi:hypothetical protein